MSDYSQTLQRAVAGLGAIALTVTLLVSSFASPSAISVAGILL